MMLRRLSGAGPPDTIKLVELHEIPGSQGISLIKAILKNDFYNNPASTFQ